VRLVEALIRCRRRRLMRRCLMHGLLDRDVAEELVGQLRKGKAAGAK
jgi:hypothetical protein